MGGIDTPYIPSDSSSDGGASEARKWAGVLALDRALVQPGDTLHVVGGSWVRLLADRLV